MKPNKPKQSFTQTAFNVQSGVSLIGARLVQNSATGTGGGGSGGFPEAPVDGKPYSRKDKSWVEAIPEAPNDGKVYARKNKAWIELNKITIDICVNGVAKKIDVYVNGVPY